MLATLVGIVVIAAACGPRLALAPTAPPASATPVPGVPASAVASASGGSRDWSHPLTAAELLAAVAGERRSTDAWRDVVYAGGVDTTRKPEPIERECAELTPCTVIGTLAGVDDPAGAIAVGHAEPEFNIPPPTTPDDLTGPIALHIPRSGPIEFLGHVDLANGAVVGSVSDAAGASATIRNGVVRAVDGWLTSVATSCGPAPIPFDPPLPNPFNCQPPGWIASDETGGGARIDVQTFAYQEFATDPEGGSNAPFPARHGVYLVRWVEYEADNCHGCQRYLVVGRLDTSTPSPNDIANMPTIRSAQELAASLAADRASLFGHVVFVDGQILPGRATGQCSGTALCSIGTLVGTSEAVQATPYAVSLLLPDTDFPTHGYLSLVVRSDGLEYLGNFGWNNGVDRSAIFPFSVLRDKNSTRGPLTVIAVGWLIGFAIPCPPDIGPTPPPDTPFGPCATDWLMPNDESLPRHTSSGDVYAPSDGIRVQSGAYQTFAPNPTSGVAQEGTYLFRLDQDWPDNPASQRGWQVVGRLQP